MDWKKLTDRRGFMTGLGQGMLLLNPMMAMLARAQSSTKVAKRFIYVFSSCGTVPEKWQPGNKMAWNGTNKMMDLSSSFILNPLQAYQSRMNCLWGVHNLIGGPGDGHAKRVTSQLSDRENNAGTVYTVNSPTGYNSGISLDQYIANQAGKASIVAGCQSGTGFFAKISSKGSDRPVSPENDPVRLYNNLFQNVTPSSGAGAIAGDLNAKRSMKKSVLDFAVSDMNRLKTRLPSELSTSMDEHATKLRELEVSINPSSQPVCDLPGVPNLSGFSGINKYIKEIDEQIENVAQAMACGLSQSAVILFGRGVDGHTLSHINSKQTKSHHSFSHLDGDNTYEKERLAEINREYAKKFKYLLDILDGIPEGNGTMLDHTVILWGNELGTGWAHSGNNIPWVLAGGGGGTLPGGRFMEYSGNRHGEILLGIANAMGYNINSFGRASKRLPNLFNI